MKLFYWIKSLIWGTYTAADIDQSIERFQKDTEGLKKVLQSTADCEEAADALNQMSSPYVNLLKIANRFPTDSDSYKRIFDTALIPLLNEISHVSTSHQCFKNKQFKHAFDRFIRNAQQKAKRKGESDEGKERQ